MKQYFSADRPPEVKKPPFNTYPRILATLVLRHYRARIRQSILRRGWMPGSSPGMTSVAVSTFRKKTCADTLATLNARAFRIVVPPQEGAGNAGWISRTHGPMCESQKAHEFKSPQVRRNDPAFPARWLYDLFRALSGDRAFLSPSPLRSVSFLGASHQRRGVKTTRLRRPRAGAFVCAPTAAIASRAQRS
jgi:hypothetical protein